MSDMDTHHNDSPTALLRSLAARALKHRRALPQGDSIGGGSPRYIAFSLGGVRLATPMADVLEILSYPDLSPVPGAKRWLRGIAQVRGRLLSIVDFSDFLEGGVTALRRSTRVLLAEHEDILCGFIVDEVMGMKQHLPPVASAPEEIDVPAWLQPVVLSTVHLDNHPWGVLAFEDIMRTPAFLQAAA